MNRSPAVPFLRSEEFRKACARFATGIAVAGVISPEGIPEGLTVNSFASVSLEPPLVLVCIAESATAYRSFKAAKAFVINVLREEQIDLSQHFAGSKRERFQGVPWHQGMHGAPILDGVLAVLECSMYGSFEVGDHTVFIGLVERVESNDGPPLLYFASAYRKLG